jgi:putative acetyltransferase
MTGQPADLKIDIIPASGLDLVRLNELVNDPRVSRYLDLIPPVPIEATLAFWKHVESGLVHIWCIWKDERIIGCTGLVLNPAGTKLSHAAAFFLYIEPAAWGTGTGDLAMQHLEAEAKKMGLLRLECQVTATNVWAIHLYERHGFVPEGAKRAAFRDENEVTDLLIMGKLIPVNPELPATPAGKERIDP